MSEGLPSIMTTGVCHEPATYLAAMAFQGPVSPGPFDSSQTAIASPLSETTIFLEG